MRRAEIDRIGALKPEDRLLVIADDEQRPHPRRAHRIAAEIFLDQRADDRPLLRVGILRLVDQDMLRGLVELEADPVADAGLGKQLQRLADQVVEVDRPGPPLGADIGVGIGTARRQRPGQRIGITGLRTDRQQFGGAGADRVGDVVIVGFGGEQLGRRLFQRVLLGEEHRTHVAQPQRAVGGRSRQPVHDRAVQLLSGGGPPCEVRLGQPFQRVAVEFVVAARRCDHRVHIARRQMEGAAQERLDAARQLRHRLRITGTFAQEPFGRALAHAQRHGGDRVADAGGASPLFLDQQFGQRFARHAGFFARFERAEAGDQPRLDREAGEQALAEAVDRLDPHAPARRVEHAREQRAGAGQQRRVVHILAQREQVGLQVRGRQAHPARQAAGDALGHFRRAGLGKGQAQDRGGIDPAQQQAEHARRQDMGLARSRRRRQPDMAVRVAGRRLVVLQPLERADLTHGHTIRCGASTGHIRHREHIREPAWRRTLRRRSGSGRRRFRNGLSRSPRSRRRPPCPSTRRR